MLASAGAFATTTGRSIPIRCLGANSSTTSANATNLYHHWIVPKQPACEGVESPIVFLHGLLGNSRNIKTMANKLCQATGRRGILIDISGHGHSKQHAVDGDLTFARAADAIQHTIVTAGVEECESIQMVGHSLGGRLSLFYATQHHLLPRPRKLWLLDTVPGKPDSSVLHTLQAAKEIIQEGEATEWKSREDVGHQLMKKYQLPKPIATWLSSQFSMEEQEFAFDINSAISLANDFPNHDFWDQLDSLPKNIMVHLVQGGKNPAWASSSLPIRQRAASNFSHHELAQAGHWVHIDDPQGLQSAFLSDQDW